MRFVALPGPPHTGAATGSTSSPVPIADGGVAQLSELGFGCAALLGRASRTESLRALAGAEEHGINFFDTARSYGYGEGESLLGDFLATDGRRARAVVCTKFGILPASRRGWRHRLKPAARTAVRLFPGLRRVAQRQAGREFTAGQFSVDDLRSSLSTSLRALRTSYVDLLLLHAAPLSVLAQDDLLEALARLVEEGTVRVAGLSAELDVVAEAFCRRRTGDLAALRTAQFALDPARLAFVAETRRAPGGMLLVANHPFGGPAGVARTRAAAARLLSRPSLSGELREKLTPANGHDLLPEIVLNCILRGTGIHAAIPAMIRPSNLRANVHAVDHCRFSAAELDLLREALLAESTEPEPVR